MTSHVKIHTRKHHYHTANIEVSRFDGTPVNNAGNSKYIQTVANMTAIEHSIGLGAQSTRPAVKWEHTDFMIPANCLVFTPRCTTGATAISHWAFVGVSVTTTSPYTLSPTNKNYMIAIHGVVEVNCALCDYESVDVPCKVYWVKDEAIPVTNQPDFKLPLITTTPPASIILHNSYIGIMYTKPMYDEYGVSHPTTLTPLATIKLV